MICEAISCGLPVACSNVCDNAIYVQDGVNGVLFDPHDEVSMANELEELLLLTDSEYETYSMESRRRAIEKLSKDCFIRQYLSLIDSSVEDNK